MSALSDARAMKDAFYKSSGQSPLTPADRRAFTGLRYYDENPALRFTLPVQMNPNPRAVQMPTSTGHIADFEQVATVTFAVNGVAQTLHLYQSDGQDGYFLPFMDATTGGETYGSGRYLDLSERSDGTVILDFNQAYNPYCAYDPERWSCPIPPKENRLTVPIEAGEKSFHADGH